MQQDFPNVGKNHWMHCIRIVQPFPFFVFYHCINYATVFIDIAIRIWKNSVNKAKKDAKTKAQSESGFFRSLFLCFCQHRKRRRLNADTFMTLLWHENAPFLIPIWTLHFRLFYVQPFVKSTLHFLLFYVLRIFHNLDWFRTFAFFMCDLLWSLNLPFHPFLSKDIQSLNLNNRSFYVYSIEQYDFTLDLFYVQPTPNHPKANC